ncbi:ZapG family protein [Snodgrassella sp. CFCC 13594]|uniref:ZapG family protein n=1 Tax=Snodgrassella sp. CFCC 13594 TaxID=1775559 RepID=UPI00082D3CFD|nr:DUF1043 family protein [Snodgrassella sp. CFCC 13594]
MNNTTWMGYVILAAILGLVVGLLLMWFFLRNSRKDKAQQQALVQKFSDYRNEVDKHFVDTAAAVDELNRSYQKVVAHLSKSAQQLMSKETLQEQLAKRADKSITVAYLAEGDSVVEHAHDDLPPPPPYTDATEAEVVPLNGQPDRVPDRVGPNATPVRIHPQAEGAGKTKSPHTAAVDTIDLQQPKA